MRISVRFECRINLPGKPVGPGHKAAATAAALAEKAPAFAFGPARGRCDSTNIVLVDWAGGLRPVACAFCGSPALVVFGHGLTVVVREIAEHVTFQHLEVVDGPDEA